MLLNHYLVATKNSSGSTPIFLSSYLVASNYFNPGSDDKSFEKFCCMSKVLTQNWNFRNFVNMNTATAKFQLKIFNGNLEICICQLHLYVQWTEKIKKKLTLWFRSSLRIFFITHVWSTISSFPFLKIPKRHLCPGNSIFQNISNFLKILFFFLLRKFFTSSESEPKWSFWDEVINRPKK